MNVLIVKDDEAIANLLYMDLSDEGYRCSIASDGKIAADMLEENGNYDLILLDIMLPEIDGYELLEYIKSTEIPVIFLTAKGTVNDRIKGLKMGADDRALYLELGKSPIIIKVITASILSYYSGIPYLNK